jgi:hypothetical protein
MVRVLVVEDGVQNVLHAMYHGLFGCEVVPCFTQVEAEKQLAEGLFNIVHLDDNLTKTPFGAPRPHQGSRILAPLALQKGCRVVGCSGEELDERGNPLWPEGVAVLTKPVSLDRFRAIVSPMLG